MREKSGTIEVANLMEKFQAIESVQEFLTTYCNENLLGTEVYAGERN